MDLIIGNTYRVFIPGGYSTYGVLKRIIWFDTSSPGVSLKFDNDEGGMWLHPCYLKDGWQIEEV